MEIQWAELTGDRDIYGNDLALGVKVRSFDFPARLKDGTLYGMNLTGERACYSDGVLEAIGDVVKDCRRYTIRVTREVWDGRERPVAADAYINPPLNGTPTSMGNICFGVVRIVKGEEQE